jgi:hypothetical protein
MEVVKTVLVLALALIAALSCATQDGATDVRAALLDSVTAEQVAWMQNGSRPAGLESMIALTTITARVDSVAFAAPNDAIVHATYKYTGRFSTGREGTLTMQRTLHFTKSRDQWVQTNLQGAESVVVQTAH